MKPTSILFLALPLLALGAAPLALALEPTPDDLPSGRVALPQVLALALHQNPDYQGARRTAEAARSQSDATGILPDPRLKFQIWNAPFSLPLRPEMYMLGVEQEFPAFGSLSAQAEAAEQGAAIAGEATRLKAESIAVQVRRAFADYLRADRAVAIRSEALKLLRRTVEQARGRYVASKGTQQEVLSAQVEVARAEADLITTQAARRDAAALLNTLMGRPVDAALGGPRPPTAKLPALGASETAAARESRSELAIARLTLARSRALGNAARRESIWPAFMVGFDYMYQPANMHMEAMNGFGLMVTMSLPWLYGRTSNAAAAARATERADESALQAATLASDFEIQSNRLRAEAAQKSLGTFDRSLVPLARQNVRSAEAGFITGAVPAVAYLDAQRAWLSARLEREEARYRYLTAHAELLRALGKASELPGAPEPSDTEETD